MSGELALRKEVIKILREFDAMPVENAVRVGVPDVECTLGWIELKKTREWPKRFDTIVRLDHELSKEQCIWINRRTRKGGKVWVLLQIDQDFLLLRGSVASYCLGSANKEQLIGLSLGTCKGLKQLKEKLIGWLK